MEKLGGRQGRRPEDGPQPRHHLGGREEAEEETVDRLLVLEPEAPQLLGLPILFLRTIISHQRRR